MCPAHGARARPFPAASVRLKPDPPESRRAGVQGWGPEPRWVGARAMERLLREFGALAVEP
jgi:hypothetical protein